MRLKARTVSARDGRAYEVGSARVRDAGALLDFLLEARRTDPDADFPGADEVRVSIESVEGLLRRMDQTDNGALLVGRGPDGIIGSLSLRGGAYRKNRHVGRLGMQVARPWRRQGVGRTLLETAVRAARETGLLEILSLEVFASNTAAVELYRSSGFSEDGRRPRFVRFADGAEDDLVLMSLRVDASEDFVA